jgi:uncharacterized protein (TIRG00374 family)
MKHKQIFFKLTRYLVVVVALGWVLRKLDWNNFLEVISEVSIGSSVAIAFVTIIGLGFRFNMWNCILRTSDAGSYAIATKVDLSISFINHLIPSRLGGIAVSPAVVRYHTGIEWKTAVGYSGYYTGMYAILYGMISVVGLLFGYFAVSTGIFVLISIPATLYMIVGVAILASGNRMERFGMVLTRMNRLAENIPIIGNWVPDAKNSIPRFADGSGGAFRRLSTDNSVILIYTVSWVLGIVVFPGIRVWILFSSLGHIFTPAFLLPVYMVMAYSVTLLPITPGGIGVAEASATVVFTSLGVPPSIAAAVVIADRFIGVYVPALIGWIPTLGMNIRGTNSEGSSEHGGSVDS